MFKKLDADTAYYVNIISVIIFLISFYKLSEYSGDSLIELTLWTILSYIFFYITMYTSYIDFLGRSKDSYTITKKINNISFIRVPIIATFVIFYF